MMRTVVCKQDGCSGNEFYISMEDGKVKAKCKVCGSIYFYNSGSYDFNMLSNCSNCNNNVFKIFSDLQKEKLYIKCMECGAPPERVFIDDEGIQVTYEEKLLHDIKRIMQQVDQRICNLELKVEGLEKGQELLEESLAYINKYMTN
ncbi:MAG: hypothetical protein E7208_00915 [Clostridium butyricum]|nr:hypothetical protein [Clostridium butyricum]